MNFSLRSALSRYSLTALLLILFSLLNGCSILGTKNREHDGLIDALSKRGVVPLSKDNPYLAPNLFIKKEAERSESLKGFLETKGEPDAIHLIKSPFFGKLNLELYYNDSFEKYTLEEIDGMWIISPPVKIDRTYVSIGGSSTVIRPLKGEKIEGTLQEKESSPKEGFSSVDPGAKSTPALKEKKSSANPETAPKPSPTPIQTITPLPEPSLEPLVPTPQAAAGKSLNTDKKLRDNSTKELERSFVEQYSKLNGNERAITNERGDIIHQVAFNGETFEFISLWYTYDRSNGPAIARINKKGYSGVLSKGEEIIIPSYMVKNHFKLDEDSLMALKEGPIPTAGN